MVIVRRIEIVVSWSENKDIEWTEWLTDNTPVTTKSMNSSDPFLLIYTSGTTGKPKVIVHTHAGFPIKAASDADYGFDLHKGDVLFWVYRCWLNDGTDFGSAGFTEWKYAGSL